MFRYPKSVSWVDGVFLRPHHFQQMQREAAAARASDRALALGYDYGIVEMETDEAALEQFSFSLLRLKAILPGGVEIDLPGNAQADALDLMPEVNRGATSVTVYAAIPPMREGAQNLAEQGSTAEPARYEPIPENCYDSNAGGNERPIMFRRLRVLLVTDPEAAPGYEKMPLVRFVCRRDYDGRPVIEPDSSFAGPALCLSGSPFLERRMGALLQHLEKVGVSMPASLRNHEMQMPEKMHLRLERMAKTGLIRSTHCVLQQWCAMRCRPAALYAELCRLAMQLAAYRPLEDIPTPEPYNHDDCLPQFIRVMDLIYRLTTAEAAEWCVRVDLEYRESADAYFGKPDPAWLKSVTGVYIGLTCRGGSPRAVADLVEMGDAFKVTAASMANSRVRGLRLVEERYPSPLLPADPNRLWFRAADLARDMTWEDICGEKACAVAWGRRDMPELQAEMYLILTKNDDKS